MSEFTPEETKRLRRLLDIEEIRDVGMLYSQLQDNAYYDRLLDIFTEDALCEFGPYGTWRGHDEIQRNYAKVYQDLGAKPFSAMHANSNHWVDVLSPTKAVGRRYLMDWVTTKPANESPLLWLGVYDEEYRKVDGRWKIARTSLQFLWPRREISAGFPGNFSPRA
jgi:SnoaL-like domain